MPRKSKEDLEIEARVRGHLRQQQAERDINDAELARRLHVHQSTVGRLLSGERGIGPGLILRISRALKITPTRLMEEEADREFRDDASRDKPRH